MNTGKQIGTVFASLLALALATDIHGGARRRVTAGSPAAVLPRLTFVGSDVLDAGTLAWRGGAKRSVVAARIVTMRIGEPAAESPGNATVQAGLETYDPHCTIRIDGIPLTTAPRVIRRNAPIGIPFTHRIEIEVQTSAPDGALHSTIAWEVTTP